MTELQRWRMIITVYLDMNRKTCAFTVNRIEYSEITWWNILPSKLRENLNLSLQLFNLFY